MSRKCWLHPNRPGQDEQVSLVTSADSDLLVYVGSIQGPLGTFRGLYLHWSHPKLQELHVYRTCTCRRQRRGHLVGDGSWKGGGRWGVTRLQLPIPVRGAGLLV